MSGGYTDNGWQGGGGVCGVCGRQLEDYGCVCYAKRMPTFDEFIGQCASDCVNGRSGDWGEDDDER